MPRHLLRSPVGHRRLVCCRGARIATRTRNCRAGAMGLTAAGTSLAGRPGSTSRRVPTCCFCASSSAVSSRSPARPERLSRRHLCLCARHLVRWPVLRHEPQHVYLVQVHVAQVDTGAVGADRTESHRCRDGQNHPAVDDTRAAMAAHCVSGRQRAGVESSQVTSHSRHSPGFAVGRKHLDAALLADIEQLSSDGKAARVSELPR